MAKATVLKCDNCESWDEKSDPVIPTGVCGPRFDLCATCRVGMLVALKVPPAKAVRYIKLSDERRLTPGVRPSLKTLLKDDTDPATEPASADDQPSLADAEVPVSVPAVGDGAELQPEPPTEALVVDEPPGDTAEEVKPAGRGRKR